MAIRVKAAELGKKEGKWKAPEWLTAGCAFLYYVIMALYKLTEAPIWQDEAMEFYCSLPVKGEIRGVTKYATMYERMAYIQQQPPLYNWVMSLWLRVDEGEWWFRFSNVVFGFVAALGLYFVLKRLCDRYMAALGVVIYSSIYILMYYIKEASEYSMLIMFLFWLTYVYLLLCEKLTAKRILAFTALCAAAVFTQYGAVFAVVPLGVGVLIMDAARKDWKSFRISIGAFAAAAAAGGFVLVYFFIIPQSSNLVSTLFSGGEIIIEKGSIFGDFLNSLMCVFRWCAIDFDRDWERMGTFLCVGMVVIAVIILYVTVRTDKKAFKNFVYCNIAIYLLYYIVTKLNIYAYGWYGNRYNMFLFPLWLVIISVSLYEFVRLLRHSSNSVLAKSAGAVKAGMILLSILYCLYGDYRISNHWWKMDLRTVVSQWYADDGYDTPTLLDFHQRYAFVYYFTHNGQYDEAQWENIVYNDVVETYSTNDPEVWKQYLHSVYGDRLPDELYLVTGQWNAFVDTFEELGYHVEAVVDGTAKLYKMTKM